MKSTLKENLQFFVNRYKTIYGDNFKIKPEGVIDNIAVSQSLVKMDFEDRILEVKKGLNPYSADGVAQNNLYSNIGLVRRQATYTVVQRTIKGTANSLVVGGSLMIENESTKDQFKLMADVTLGNDGLGVGSFKSELIGAIDLPSDANVIIKTPLPNVVGVYFTSGNDINIGLTYESNSEFRKRWLNWSRAENKLKAELLDLVDNSGDVIIRQNRNLPKYSFPLHTMAVTINSAEPDGVVAKKIFDSLEYGVGLYGNISVIVKDDSNQDVDIKFSRSTGCNIWIKTNVKKVADVPNVEVVKDTLQAIQDYYKTATFVMGSPVIGNRFNQSIDDKTNIDYVISTQVSLGGASYVDVATIGEFEIPVFDLNRIVVKVL